MISVVMQRGWVMVRSIEVLLAVLLVVGFVFFILMFVEYLDWSSGIGNTAPKLTFNAFEKLYVLNPSKWKFFSDYVVYCPNDDMDNTFVIEFKHFCDVVRYKIFRDRYEANREELERIRREKEFLEYVQNDINTYREENLAEIKRTLEVNNRSKYGRNTF